MAGVVVFISCAMVFEVSVSGIPSRGTGLDVQRRQALRSQASGGFIWSLRDWVVVNRTMSRGPS